MLEQTHAFVLDTQQFIESQTACKLPLPTSFLHLFSQVGNPRIFPQQYGVPFPANFMDVVRTVYKRLFRVYAHIYHTHFRSVCGLGEEAHLNTCFKHFMYFTQVGACTTANSAIPVYNHLPYDHLHAAMTL